MRSRTSARLAAALAGLALASTAGPGPGRAADLAPLMTAYHDAADPPARAAAVAAIRAANPDPLEVEAALRRGRTYRPAATGWQVFQHKGLDGKTRPYHVYVPKAYDPSKKYPAFVSLHGGVSRPSLLPEAVVAQVRAGMDDDAEKHGRIVVLPLGERGATWFDKVGAAGVLAQLAEVKRRYNVDDDRVSVGGFSDGASGGLYMGMYHPTPWAGVVALSGSVIVPMLAPDHHGFPANLAARPIHAANGGLDPLYPSAVQKGLIDQLRALGARVEWTDYPDSGHDNSYMPKEDAPTEAFLRATVRDPNRARVVWEAADPEVGRCDWVRIDEVRDVGNNRGPGPSTLTFIPPPFFAFAPDPKFAGPGLRVAMIPPGSLAAAAGLKPGDVVTALEGLPTPTAADLQKAAARKLAAKRAGDTIRGDYSRDGKPATFRVAVPPAPPLPQFQPPARSARIEAAVKDNRVDVTVRGVARYTLFVRRGLFDLSRPIRVVTNGAPSFEGTVTPDLAFLLDQAAADNDRSAVSVARIEVTVPAGGSKPASGPSPGRR